MRTAAVWAVLAFGGLPAFGQPAGLATTVPSYSVSAANLADVLVKVAYDFKIPVGIEWIQIPDAVKPFARSWRRTTAGDILADIVKAYPGYVLDTGGEVVHVRAPLPGSARFDILNYRLDRYEVAHQTVNEVTAHLECELAPLVNPPLPNQPTLACGGSTLVGGGDARMTFTIDKPSVGEILDRLLIGSGRAAWVVAYPAQLKRTKSGYLKTARSDGYEPPYDSLFMPTFDFRIGHR